MAKIKRIVWMMKVTVSIISMVPFSCEEYGVVGNKVSFLVGKLEREREREER
jgi:hypothetical protein